MALLGGGYALYRFIKNNIVPTENIPVPTINISEVKTLRGHTGPVTCLHVSADGTIFSVSADKTIKIWDSKGNLLHTIITNHTEQIDCIAVCEKFIITGARDNTIKLWNRLTGALIKTLAGHTDWVTTLRTAVTRPISGSQKTAGTRLISGSQKNDCSIKLWKIPSGKCIQTFSGHEHAVSSLYANLATNTIISSSWDKTIKIWDSANGTCLATLEPPTPTKSKNPTPAENTDSTTTPAESTDPSATTESTDPTTTTESIDPTVTDPTTTAESINPTVAAENTNSTTTTESIDPSASPKGPNLLILHNFIRQIAVNEDGSLIFAVSDDKNINVWNSAKQKCIKTFAHGHQFPARCIAVNKAGTLLATGANDNTVKLWDVAKKQCIKTLTGHTDWINAIVLDTEKQILISASDDNTIKIWHLTN